jgi:hypothetical protein
MEQRKPISHIVAGLLIAGIVIVFSMVMNFAGGSASSPGSGWITYLIICGGLILFINLYGKAKDNYVTFGNLFSYGFKATAALTAIFVLFMVLLSFLSHEFKEKGLAAARQQMESQGKLSDDQIDQSLNIASKYFWLFAIGGTVLVFIIVGAIGSLIGAAITKKRPVTPFDQLPQ